MRLDLVVALITISTMSACGAVGLPVRGRVLAVDATHGPDDPLPVADALVVGFTSTKLVSVGHPSWACLHVDVARTDANGVYRMPGWVRRPTPGVAFDPRFELFVFKDGYVARSDIDDGRRSAFDRYLAPDVEPDMLARLREFRSVIGRCMDASPTAQARLAHFLDVEVARLTPQTYGEREAIRDLRRTLQRESQGNDLE